MIRNTTGAHLRTSCPAYKDNAAVMTGPEGERFRLIRKTTVTAIAASLHILMKVETHNHPTAISPFPGAATGSGGDSGMKEPPAAGPNRKPD